MRIRNSNDGLSFVEKSVKEQRGNFSDYTLDELEEFWQQAKGKGKGDEMRIDKFLKVSRLIKRRTLAKQVADQGRITINDKVAKASSVVKEGDELAIRFGQKIVTVKIEEIKEYDEKRRMRHRCIQSLRKRSWKSRT